MPARGAYRKLLITHIQRVFTLYIPHSRTTHTYIIYSTRSRTHPPRDKSIYPTSDDIICVYCDTKIAMYACGVIFWSHDWSSRPSDFFSEKRAGGGRCRDTPDRTRARAPTCVSRHPPSTLITHHGEGTTHAIYVAAFYRLGASRMTSERRRARRARGGLLQRSIAGD